MYFARMVSGLGQPLFSQILMQEADALLTCQYSLRAWLALVVQESYVNWLSSILKLGGIFFNKLYTYTKDNKN